MTTPARTAAPPSALLLWTDNLSLYVQLPGPDALPVVIRYPLTTAGLSSAIGLIRTRAYDGGDRPYTPPQLPNLPGTPAQRENAREVLRRLGVIG